MEEPWPDMEKEKKEYDRLSSLAGLISAQKKTYQGNMGKDQFTMAVADYFNQHSSEFPHIGVDYITAELPVMIDSLRCYNPQGHVDLDTLIEAATKERDALGFFMHLG